MKSTASSPTSDCLAAHLPDDRTRQHPLHNWLASHLPSRSPRDDDEGMNSLKVRSWEGAPSCTPALHRVCNLGPLLALRCLTTQGMTFHAKIRCSCRWHAVKFMLDPVAAVARLGPRLSRQVPPFSTPPQVLQTPSRSSFSSFSPAFYFPTNPMPFQESRSVFRLERICNQPVPSFASTISPCLADVSVCSVNITIVGNINVLPDRVLPSAQGFRTLLPACSRTHTAVLCVQRCSIAYAAR